MYSVGFSNVVQVALYNVEMRGQISDGHWENADPPNHYEKASDAEAFVASTIKQLGPTWKPLLNYGFSSPELFAVVGDRMRLIGKIAIAFPLMTADNIDRVQQLGEYVLDRNYTQVETLDAVKTKFADKDFALFGLDVMDILKVRTLPGLVAAYEYILSMPLDNKLLKQELREMSAIFSGKYQAKILKQAA